MRGATGEPAIDPARNAPYGTVGGDRQHVIDGPVEERAVVAGGHQRAGPVVEERLERPQACRGRGRWSVRRAPAGWAWSPAPSPAGDGAARRPTAFEPGRTGRSSRTRTVRAGRDPPSRAGESVRRRARARPHPGRATSSAGRRSPVTTVAPRLTSPAVGRDRPAMMSSSVDLPEPLGPTTPSRAPGSINRSTSRTTTSWSSPYDLATPISSTTWLPRRVVPTSSNRSSPRTPTAAGPPDTISPAARSRAFGLVDRRERHVAATPARAGRGSFASPPRRASRSWRAARPSR